MKNNVLNEMQEKLKEGLPQEMLFDFMHEEYHKRRAERKFWEEPTREKWEAERKELKEIFREIFSPFPESVGLNVRTSASYQRDGYRMDCLCYDTAPGVVATANLYVPNTAQPGKTPAVVVACGHRDESKSAYRYVAEAVVKAGMVALCFDPPGQGERYESWNYVRWQGRMQNEHDRVGALALLLGGNMAGAFAWDCMRAVDCLLTVPETDPERIGFMGTSGGGTQTTWAATLDERIAVAVPSCFITSIDDLLTTREPADSEQNPPGMLAYGLEYRDFLGMMAPKPVLVLGAEKDFFPIEGAADTVNSLKKLYACYGAEERIELFRAQGSHQGRGIMSTIGVQWLCRWFGLPVPEFPEGEYQRIEKALKYQPELDEETFAAEGQLMFGPESSNYWNYYRNCIKALQPEPLNRERLRKTLAVKKVEAPVEMQKRFERKHERLGSCLTGGWLNSQEGITIPWIYARAKQDTPSKRLCILSHEDGMTGFFANGREGELLLEQGVDVLAFDPRGVGVTRGGAYGWWSNEVRKYLLPLGVALYSGALGYVDPVYEAHYSTSHELGTHGHKLNQPVVGQRVTDTLRVLSCIKELTGKEDYEIVVYGAGYSAVWMLYGALLTEEKLAGCVLHGPIASLKLLADCPEHRYYMEHLARRQLLDGDIPQALSALECPALVVDPVDSMRLPMNSVLAEEVLKDTGAKRIYTEGMINPLYKAVEFIKDC